MNRELTTLLYHQLQDKSLIPFNNFGFCCVMSMLTSWCHWCSYILLVLLNKLNCLSFNFPAEQKIQENETLDKLVADLDQNGDLEIDFKEFITLIAMVTSACSELFQTT